MAKHIILIIEDETPIRDMLNFTLSSADFDVVEAANAESGWNVFVEQKPDLVIVDWMLPGMSGVNFIERLQKRTDLPSVPTMLLTAKGAEEDQVKGLGVGADDYVVKPFSPRALVARCQALLRRNKIKEQNSNLIKTTNLTLDIESHRFMVRDTEIKLGPIEFKLMQFFMENPNRVYSREQLLNQVWGVNVVVEERTVDVHIRRLRKLLETVNIADSIQTVRGAGYRFFD